MNKEASGESINMFREQMGHTMGNAPPIIQQVLCHLSILDLNRSSQVCKMWLEIARRIKKQRKSMFWMFKVAGTARHGMDTHISINNHEHSTFFSENKFDVGIHFSTVLHNAFSEPSVALLFSTDKFYSEPELYFPNYDLTSEEGKRRHKRMRLSEKSKDTGASSRPYYMVPVMDFMAHQLPKNCKMVGINTVGIVGTPLNNLHPMEVETLDGFTALFLPSVPGIDIYPFGVSKTAARQILQPKTQGRRRRPPPEYFYDLTGIPNDKEIKCVFIFMKEFPRHEEPAALAIDYLLVEMDWKFALGGALVKDFSAPKSDRSGLLFSGIAFCGKAVKAASILLKRSVTTAEKVEAKLQELKQCGIPEDHTVAFMFACCERGHYLYGKSNVEAETFRKVFPTVPLFGLFGNGEVGINYLPKPSEAGKYIPGRMDIWSNWTTTVFVLLHLPVE